ncbi:MAG: GNAT family N-acetyltransferase, partial [Clostridiales bacterium]|nr:GNAT family N-acetyltransferase [Clostridiales bacterium]
MLRASWLFGMDHFEAARAVRMAVFVKEQGYTEEEEFDDFDYYAWHTVVYYNDEPIATGRVYLDNGRFCIGRICVLKEYRGQHVGDLVVRLLLDRALNAGAEGVFLSAQTYAQGFYEKFGLKPNGKAYMPKGDHIEHIDMYAEADEIIFPHNCEGCPNNC